MNFADEVVDEVKKLYGEVKTELHKDFKRDKPFRKEKIDPYEEYMQYRIISQHPQRFNIMGALIGMYGEDAVNTWLYDMSKFEVDGRRNLGYNKLT